MGKIFSTKSKDKLDFACLDCGDVFKDYASGLFIYNHGIMAFPQCPKCDSYDTYELRDGKRDFEFESRWKNGEVY